MNKLSTYILAAVQLAGTWMAVAQTGQGPGSQAPVIAGNINRATIADGDDTSAPISVSARNLDFGAVPVGSNNELSFKIQNVGSKTLTGTVDVSTPFSILGGKAFVLEPAQTHVITVQYAPRSTGMHMTVVHLTGASITVMGSAPRAPKAPARRRRPPTHSDGQRLLALKQESLLRRVRVTNGWRRDSHPFCRSQRLPTEEGKAPDARVTFDMCKAIKQFWLLQNQPSSRPRELAQ